MDKPEQRMQCDVLVIGGGAAGLTAAIEARARGADVLLAAKGKAGRSGNTIVAGGQFATVVPFPGSEDSPELHFSDSLAGGQNINDERLLWMLVSQGGRQLLKMEEWGVPFVRSEGELVRRMPAGHSCARGIPANTSAFPITVGGLAVTLPLRALGQKRGVRFLDEVPAIRLLLDEGRIRGALLIDLNRGLLVQVEARSVVVAAGGGGRLYAITNNTRDICGDSYGLLLEAGVALKDMEFVQFYPCQLTHPYRAAVTTGAMADGATLRNRHGERFMQLYDPVNADRATRDVMSRAIFAEVEKGNGVDGEVYVDYTEVPEAVLVKKYGPFVRELSKHGVDLSRDWIKVGNTTHFFMGGAAIDEGCGTAVPGLFAAGEAAGGVHGANRIAGNALVETIVFGPVAGQAAAEYALRDRRDLPSSPDEHLETAETGDVSLDEVRSSLRQAMWKGSSLIRSEGSLQATLSVIRECRSALEHCPTPSMVEAARREETRLMCLVAETIVRSALARKESRGAHHREDYPSSEAQWLGSHLVRLAGGELQVEFVPKG